jgi:hypothetical protein
MRDAEGLGLDGEVFADAGAGEDDDPDWQGLQHLVVALEWRGLGVACPIRPEGNLDDLAVVGPAGGGALGAARAAAIQQHHARMLGVDLVERRSDTGDVVAFDGVNPRRCSHRPGCHLFWMACALSAGAQLIGTASDRMRRGRVSSTTTLAGASLVLMTLELLIVACVPISSYVPWSAFAVFDSLTVVSFAILGEL